MSPAITYSSTTNVTKASKSVYSRQQKKANMSVTQTYFLAHSARGKLSREASRPDHNLRLLVGHANMLDSLMIDLANAEQEQERWFNRTVLGVDTEDSEDEEEDVQTANSDDEEGEDLELVHTTSSNSPPELTSDSDSDSDDEQAPPSPDNNVVDTITLKQRQALVTSSYYEGKKGTIATQQQPTIIAAF